MGNNMVSIIMPMYNAEKFIADSIESVIRQTYTDWELIIINDCSNDKSLDIVERYIQQDKRIKLSSLKKNSGVAQARNKGIDSSCGRYISFLDSDDIWLEDKLEKQITFMQIKNIAFSYTQYRQFSNSVKNCGKLIDVYPKIDYQTLLKGNNIGCLSVMIDKTIINEIYMPSERHEDYICWLNILKKGFCAYGLKEDLARYRVSAESLSGNKFKSMMWTWTVYRKNQNLSLIKSCYYFCHYIINGLRKHAKE